ncbi:hypothetical protein OHV92_18255 [Acinetobacter baumannii]|nr:hypothetical protein [Acinetobacter baumannii]MDC5112803.1 hypothetical protein [Acinetobacter baumannii]
MAQKDLKDKIKRIWIWTIVGIIVFLIISFFLKSSYPINHYKFNLSDAYDVLKDTLTLAAAFLAPVAAFVLFNDWREQHKVIKIENDVEKIIQRVQDTNKILLILFNSICSGKKNDRNTYLKVFELKNEIYLHVDSILNDVKRLNIPFDEDLGFNSYATLAAEIMKESATAMYLLQEEFDKSDDKFIPDIKEISVKLESLLICQKELSKSAIYLKI